MNEKELIQLKKDNADLVKYLMSRNGPVVGKLVSGGNMANQRAIPLSDLQKIAMRAVAKTNFTQVDELVNLIIDSLELGRNLLLHGPTGEGKTAVLNAMLNVIEVPHLEVSFKEGIPLALNGGKVENESDMISNIMTYSLEKLDAYPIIIISELGDSSDSAIENFKDLGRTGNHAGAVNPLATKAGYYKNNFFATSNRSPLDLLESKVGTPSYNSVEAALNRFELSMQVGWKDYSRKAFLDLFALDKELVEVKVTLAEALAYVCNKGRKLPPTTTTLIADTYKSTLDIKSGVKTPNIERFSRLIHNTNGISSSEAAAVVEALRNVKIVADNKEEILAVKNMCNAYKNNIMSSSLSNASKEKLYTVLIGILQEVRKNVKTNDGILEALHLLIIELDRHRQQAEKSAVAEAEKTFPALKIKLHTLFNNV